MAKKYKLYLLGFLIYFFGCVEALGIEVNECTFFVTREEPLCLTYDILMACRGQVQIYAVEFNQ
jgi:hypothetical protein